MYRWREGVAFHITAEMFTKLQSLDPEAQAIAQELIKRANPVATPSLPFKPSKGGCRSYHSFG
jgi:hypothetical protein